MFDAYKVAVKLTLVNGVSSGLAALAMEFNGLNKHVNNTQNSVTALESKLKGIAKLGMIGGGMAVAGGFGLSLFKAPLEEAKLFQTEMTKFASLGFGDSVNNQAVKFANGMNTFGTSARDNLALLGDAMAVFKDMEHAKFAAPMMAKMKFANQAVFGAEGGGNNDRKFMDMLKVIEFRGGLKSEDEFKTQANYVQQVISGSRNRVDAGQLLQALKTGGVGLSQRSNEKFYLGSEPLIQEFGGQRYGTGAMSIYQNLVQSRGTITAQQELYRLGLLDKSKVSFNSMGMLKKALPGAFNGSEILEKDGELALLEKVLLPAFAAKGITGDEGIIREIGMILGNRTGSSLMSRIYQQRNSIHNQSEANKNALNIDGLDAKARGTMAGKEIEMQAKWRDVMKELGTTILPIAIKAVVGLTSVLKNVISFAKEFPIVTKGLVIAFGVLSGLVAVGGVVMLATAAFSALGLALTVGAGGGLGLVIGGVAVAFLPLTAAIVGVGAALYGVKWLIDWANRPETLAQKNSKAFAVRADSAYANESHRKWNDFSFDTVKPSSYQKPIQVQSNIHVDGKKIAEAVTNHQAKAASKPFGGQSAFDMSMTPLPAGMRFNR